MYLPKADIYSSLKTLGYFVAQKKPSLFRELPAITFSVSNSINRDLDNNILSQNLEVQIDIWADDSVSASNVLSEVENLMRQNFYNMSYSNDVPNNGNVFHILTRFVKTI